MAETAQDNEVLIRKGYELFNSGNLEALADIFDPNAVWHAAGRGRLSGEKRGREAVFAYFRQLGEGSGGTFRADLHDVVADVEHVVGLHTETARRGSAQLNVHTALLFHVRGGRIVEAWEHLEDTQAFDEFFA